MKRLLALASVALLCTPALFAQRRRVVAPPSAPAAVTAPFGQPLPGMPAALLPAFDDGRRAFTKIQQVGDGLGPVFNAPSCADCHNAPAVGGGSQRNVVRIGTRVNGVFDPLLRFGGSLLQSRAIGMPGSHLFRPELAPREATIIAVRRSTPLFGLGLVDATSDFTFIALAAMEAVRGDGTAGRVALVDNAAAGTKTAGKFGWKAQVPTLLQFSGDAYLNELGITSPDFPDENCPGGDCAELRFNPRPGLNDDGTAVRAVAGYMAMLAAPPRGAITADVAEGERIFARIGCNACHVETLTTGANPNRALDRVVYHPYSDFLLHDMGALGDGIEQGAAAGNEMRTAPLWGLSAVRRFLHDGRASTLEAAIAAHDGQGRAARERFAALDAADRTRLVAFLRSL
ncbi:MAG TPA: di-heme oxidoredictase family protein [Thermoanaerobaculia bacterium]|jgi:CxxC motif-containing protein (DUF1111 family)